MATCTDRSCGSSNLEENDQGHLVCCDCGIICREVNIVQEVQFQSSGDGNQMIGNFIADDGLNNPLSQVGQRNSRESTLRKAKDEIKTLCAKLRLKVGS